MTTEAAAPADAGTTPTTGVAPAGDQTTAAPAAQSPATVAAPAVVETPAEGKTDTAAEPASTEAVAKAPDKYEFKAPEGQELAPAVMGKFEALARELNLSQDQAQKFVSEVAPELAKAQTDAKDQIVSQWTAAAKTDKEFGGANLTENLAIAKQALETFGTPELTKLLNETGLGSNPELIRAFYRAGKQISQSKLVAGTVAPQTQNQSAASKLYPGMN